MSEIVIMKIILHRYLSHFIFYSFHITHNMTTVTTYSKKVSFYPDVLFLGTLHRRDCSATELRQTYYTMEELKQMKRSCRALARNLSAANFDSQSKDVDPYLRGLEGRTSEGLLKKRTTKKNAREAVFREQCRQRELGINNSCQIADAYFEVTELTQVSAQMLGLRDEKEARNLNKNLTTTGGDVRSNSMVLCSRNNIMSRRMKNLIVYGSKKLHLWENSMVMTEY